MVQETGIAFHGFDKRFLELLASNTGKTLMGGSGGFINKINALLRLGRDSWKLQSTLIETQKVLIQKYAPDKVFFHPKCVYPILMETVHPGTNILVCPIPCIVHKVNEYTTMGIKGNGNYGMLLNSFSYWATNWIRTVVFFRMAKKQRKDLTSHPSLRDLYQTLVHKTKTLYTISPSLFPRPQYWSNHLYVTGFLTRKRSLNWHPEENLLHFLSNHEKILFVSFGSMTNREPEAKTNAILNVLRKHKIPAIINTSWGGLTATENCNHHLIFVDNIPYEWVFPRVYAVVHHGGSGTTHEACKHGCPSLIIPHIVDQFFWNKRIASLGLGPQGVPINKLSEKTLSPLLLDLWQNKKYRENARVISQKMAQEGQPESILGLVS